MAVLTVAIMALTHDVLDNDRLFALTSFEFNSHSGGDPNNCRASINTSWLFLTGHAKIYAATNPHELLDILNKSLNETLSRTVMTLVTTLLPCGTRGVWRSGVNDLRWR